MSDARALPSGHPTPPPRVRLPVRFDAAALLAEARALPEATWSAHFNASYHNGQWHGVALRGRSDDPTRLYVGPAPGTQVSDEAARATVDTPVLGHCPRLAEVLAFFRCPVRSARLLRLGPGGVIDEHCDYDLSYAHGDVRVHVVLGTGPAVEFYVDGERVAMSAGECWYLDLARPHRVVNRGSDDRIHLVLDLGVDDWLRGLIAAGDTPARLVMAGGGAAEFERFRDRVFADADLAARLRAETRRDAFVALAVALGHADGYDFDASDVTAAMAAGQRRWIEQWLV